MTVVFETGHVHHCTTVHTTGTFQCTCTTVLYCTVTIHRVQYTQCCYCTQTVTAVYILSTISDCAVWYTCSHVQEYYFFSITIYRLAKLLWLFRLLYFFKNSDKGPEVSPTLITSTVLYYTLGTVYNFNFTTVNVQRALTAVDIILPLYSLFCSLLCRNYCLCTHYCHTIYTIQLHTLRNSTVEFLHSTNCHCTGY